MTKFLKKERKVLDENNTSWLEILQHSFVNFLYGFSSGIVLGFTTIFITNISIKNSIYLFLSYFIYKQIESRILNRNKYVSKLGKNYIFPIPSSIGFVLGAYLSIFV